MNALSIASSIGGFSLAHQDGYNSQMKTATLTETKNGLSALIDQVRDGETILILDRGRPVARLTSAVDRDAGLSSGRVDRLERRGILQRAREPVAEDLLRRPRPKAREGGSLLEVLLEERSTGR
ncbi:MAG: type II toxin-antitoxin system prevent-host-death family antitoxin [Acidobacteriota bacterium]